MQKLRERRLTNTPWGIPQAPCNCGLSLNSSEGRNGVADLKTSFNSIAEKSPCDSWGMGGE